MPKPLCLIDTHVHLYPDIPVERVLEAAAAHFTSEARRRGYDQEITGMLMLTESNSVDLFSGLPRQAGRWSISPTDEAECMLATPAEGGLTITIVSGRQIVTQERIEVHALGTRQFFDDGQPIEDVLDHVVATGALAVLPWGVGKWSGARGVLMRDLVERADNWPNLMLADSGVRARLAPRPTLLDFAEEHGLKILAGSDPLPLAQETQKAGRFGIVAPVSFNPERPLAGFTDWVKALPKSPETYGSLEPALTFFHRQLAMQARKRF